MEICEKMTNRFISKLKKLCGSLCSFRAIKCFFPEGKKMYDDNLEKYYLKSKLLKKHGILKKDSMLK